MGDGMRCLIWCDEYCGENWDDVSRWVHAGRAMARSGRLKLEHGCDGCGASLPAGSSVEAVTLHFDCGYVPWEEELLERRTGWEEVEGGDECVEGAS